MLNLLCFTQVIPVVSKQIKHYLKRKKAKDLNSGHFLPYSTLIFKGISINNKISLG
jgi:hypothetical protein